LNPTKAGTGKNKRPAAREIVQHGGHKGPTADADAAGEQPPAKRQEAPPSQTVRKQPSRGAPVKKKPKPRGPPLCVPNQTPAAELPPEELAARHARDHEYNATAAEKRRKAATGEVPPRPGRDQVTPKTSLGAPPWAAARQD